MCTIQLLLPFYGESRDINTLKYNLSQIVPINFKWLIACQEKDFLKIKDLAMKEKQLSTIQKWMNEKIEETYISVNQDSRDCNFSNKWLKK